MLDDRWASAREDLARIAAGETVDAGFIGAGKVVAAQARWHAAHSDPRLSERFAQIAADALSPTGQTWSGELAVVTGASQGSIAAAVTGKLLAGGATVVATTSGLDPRRLAFYKELYRTHAVDGAALWIVPANMASYRRRGCAHELDRQRADADPRGCHHGGQAGHDADPAVPVRCRTGGR